VDGDGQLVSMRSCVNAVTGECVVDIVFLPAQLLMRIA
jgi:hypothetical protein